MGEIGSGKTTLLDVFVNYLANMNYEDKWRYKLVDENHIKDLPPEKSQTSIITDYYVNYERDSGEEINIRIVDTPGFGDTGGVEKDNEIIQQFEEFFRTTMEIDYILVTVKSSTTRLTYTKQYVYDRVQDIFGKDAKDRFILMCSFSDGQKPLVLGTLEVKIHYEEYFCFNNSALYIPPDLGNSNTKFFWKLGMENVKRFFDIILQKNLPPLSLKLSKEVMFKRNWLFENVKNSQQIINEDFKMLDDSRELLEKIKKNKALIDQNGSSKKKHQFCGNCKVMCCRICKWPANEPYSQCSYFSGGSGCPKFPGKCDRYAHVRANEYVVYDEEEKEVIIDAKKQVYEEGKKGLSSCNMLFNQNLNRIREKILKQMKEIKSSLE